MSRRHGDRFSDQVSKSYQRLRAEGAIKPGIMASPGRSMKITPGWKRHLVRTTVDEADGTQRHRDATEALNLCHKHPSVQHMRYVGVSRGWHVFEYPPPGRESEAVGGRVPANTGSRGDWK